jgi:uncharacterized membrane protein YhaH (DUF805 family)
MNWYLKVIKQYANFSGRARRTEYWMFTLINTLISIGLMIITQFVDQRLSVLNVIYSLALLIPALAVIVRRLHDVNKSGWMYLLMLLPIIGWIWILVLLFTEGTRGENKYGVDPKAETETI